MYISDWVHILSSPLRWDKSSYYKIGGVVAITGILYAYDEKMSGEDRLEKLIKKSEDIFIDDENGCIMGNVGVEFGLGLMKLNKTLLFHFLEFENLSAVDH